MPYYYNWHLLPNKAVDEARAHQRGPNLEEVACVRDGLALACDLVVNVAINKIFN